MRLNKSTVTIQFVISFCFAFLLIGCGQSKVEEMTAVLESGDVSERRGACLRLGLMKSRAQAAYDYVLEQYRDDPSLEVRADCLEALGKIGGKKGTADILIKALQNSSEVIQLHAIRGLGKLGSSKAVEPLSELLSHEDSEIREATAHSLQEINDPKALPALGGRLEVESNESVRTALETAVTLIKSNQ